MKSGADSRMLAVGRISFYLIMVVSIGMFCGCTKPRFGLNPSARSQLKTLEIVIGIKQTEINADIEKSQVSKTMGGGLIPALIDGMVDNERAKKAEANLQSLRNALVDYDFAGQLSQALGVAMFKLDGMVVQAVQIDHDVPTNWMSGYYNKTKAQAILFVEASYFMSPHYESVTCIAQTKLYPVEESLTAYSEKPKSSRKDPVKPERCIYRNDMIKAEITLGGISDRNTTKEMNDVLLEQAPRIKEKLTALAAETAEAIRYDMTSN